MIKLLERYKNLRRKHRKLMKSFSELAINFVDLKTEKEKLDEENDIHCLTIEKQNTEIENFKKIINELENQVSHLKSQYKNSISKNKVIDMIDCLNAYDGFKEDLQDILNRMEE